MNKIVITGNVGMPNSSAPMILNIRIEIPSPAELNGEKELVVRIDGDSIGLITDKRRTETSRCCLMAYMKTVIGELSRNGQLRTAETYLSALRSFRKFRNSRDIRIDKVDGNLIRKYEHYLKHRKLTLNTISFYMRILRAVYNRAVAELMITDSHPFRGVYTGIGKTEKRALTAATMKSIRNLAPKSDAMAFARDIFLLSFYTRGMSFIDLAHLKKTDLSNGILSYCRKKTGQRIRIRWEPCMQEIADRWPSHDSEYLLPIIKTGFGKERTRCRNTQCMINYHLKNIARQLNMKSNLTMYMARHTWASIAKSKNIPLAVISDSMGHLSPKTTQIYLASIDSSVIDRANKTVINSI